jgi:sodium-dependent dicarboxylate transporter 2/3/5
MGVFAGAVALWMIPGLIDLCGGRSLPVATFLRRHLPEETVGLMAGIALMVLPEHWREGRFTLTWREAVRIDWGTIFIFAGGMALGKQLFDTGLAKAIGMGAAGLLGQPGLWTVVAIGIGLSLVVSEAASNTASATVMVPVMIAVARGAGVDPVPVALASCLACSFGFLLPVSTGPNALAWSTGHVTLRQMMRSGLWLDVIGGVTIFIVVRVITPFMRSGG